MNFRLFFYQSKSLSGMHLPLFSMTSFTGCFIAFTPATVSTEPSDAANPSSEPTYVMEEVLVTATRDKVLLFELSSTLYILGVQELTNKQVRSLPEALEETPGVSVQKTTNGQGSPFLRGFTGYRTLALIDGVRYNNSVYRDGPNEYFSLIDVNTLNKIELLNGPASTLYGSDAIGGTLNLKTKAADYSTEPNGTFFKKGSQSYRYSSSERSHSTRTELAVGQGKKWGLHIGYSWKDFGNVDAAAMGLVVMNPVLALLLD